MNHTGFASSGCILATLILHAATVFGQVDHSTVGGYSITYTDLLPAGQTTGLAYGIVGGQQVGGSGCPGIWAGTAGSFVNLTPPGASGAEIFDTTGSQQAGYAYFPNGGSQAGIWSGTAGSFQSLHPAGAVASLAHATSGNQQVGYTDFGNDYLHHASLWTGTASSFVDLHPSWAHISYAWDTSGSRQVGSVSAAAWYYQNHAALWSGTASSFVDLNPPGASFSVAYGIAGNQIAGYALFASGGDWHAGYWSGTAGSFVDLHPAGATKSLAAATTGQFQAGSVNYGGGADWHAVVWFGSASAMLDLQAALGPGYSTSEANALWTDGSVIQVAGNANNSAGYPVPILWTITQVPEPGVLAIGLIGVISLYRLRRG